MDERMHNQFNYNFKAKISIRGTIERMQQELI